MLVDYLHDLNRICLKRLEGNERQYLTFAIYGLINTIIPYLLWEYNSRDAFLIVLHIGASILCFVLIFVKDWLPVFKQFLPLYWYFTLFYCLPLMSTYMLFENGLSIGWALNSILALFLLSFLVDWLAFLVLLSTGIILGWFLSFITNGFVQIKGWENYNYVFLTYMYLSSIVIGGIFARNKAYFNQEKEEYLKLLGGTIAHELHTPLLSIAMGINKIKEYTQVLSKLDEHNEKNSSNSLDLRAIEKVLENMEQTNKASFVIVEMFLMKLKSDFANVELNRCSMQVCIESTFKQYYLTEYERSLINYKKGKDFFFIGNEILTIHMLFNLLKNALYYVKAANKGRIYISLSKNKKYNTLVFKDTGKGIPANMIKNVFQKFYSRTKYGTGIGLSFCKLVMDAFGGSIECKSKEGEFTEFILLFPSLKK